MRKQRLITNTSYYLSSWFLNHWQVGKRPILILGHGRSGTSWVGKTLSTANRAIYYYEPCNLDITGKGNMDTWFRYTRPGERDDLLENAFDNVFKDLPFGGGWYRGFWARALPNYQIIVKDVASLMSIEWVFKRYNPKLLVIVRHPCPTVLSEINKETPAELSRDTLLHQSSLFQDHLEPYRSVIEAAKTPIEIFSAIWAARHRVVADALSRNPEWLLIFYEELCLDPIGKFKELFEQFELPWNRRVENHVLQSSTNNIPGRYSKVRISNQQINKWKQTMNQSEVEVVRNYVKLSDLPFYQSDQFWSLET
ncbi:MULTISPECIES: sulfotransferase [Moorena]|uniref:Sulfotransferase domain-containing protein n=1 Tax=Moorena bouillonii PNG TaxID=568701 RepID=A0A1U7MYS3_9CYAN|nr:MULTISPECIES: sulfotransferase [Moorena]NEO11841.1 sulfotransferase [Moorena sp. SIO3E8]NEP28514.1 sulfotransferase [Moorena sp. SIO3I6]NEP98760.1 sulfotransferase [Moorena sp. SIO3F7]OLT58868.1 hypothetical protein BJP37_07245 [Moorena bouillonii PNG]